MSFHDATLEFEYEHESRAQLVAESVGLEVGEIDDDRSETTVERDGSCVRIDVRAGDVVALRAALNTWFTLVDVAERTASVGDGVVETR